MQKRRLEWAEANGIDDLKSHAACPHETVVLKNNCIFMNTPPPPPPSAGSQFPPLCAIESYKPTGKIGALGLPLALITLIFTPFLVAFIYYKTAHFGLGLFSSMWFIVGAALLLGIVVGLSFFPAIQWGKIRNPTLMATIGLIAGTAAWSGALYLEANDNREERIAMIKPGRFPQPEPEPVMFAPPIETVKSYLSRRAEAGQEVTGRGGRGANINGGMFWALLGIEGLLCALGAAVAAHVVASRRYSEEFGRWMKTKTLFNFPNAAAPELVALANARDWTNFAARARAAKGKDNQNVSSATVYTMPEQEGGVLTIRSVIDPKQPIATVYEKLLTPAELNAISTN